MTFARHGQEAAVIPITSLAAGMIWMGKELLKAMAIPSSYNPPKYASYTRWW